MGVFAVSAFGQPVCGDGKCDEGEMCPGDCGGGYCGNGICEPGEACPEDCQTQSSECDHDGVCEPENGEDGYNCPDCRDWYCGDGTCNLDEPGSCPTDCGGASCGDGNCDAGEGPYNCPADCKPAGYCGDGACDMGESPDSCPSDCGAPGYCGDGACGPNESPQNCPSDCKANCGNAICDPGESPESCPSDCRAPSKHCGDTYCDRGAGEDEYNCPSDCETQPSECDHDGVCEPENGENEYNCPDCRDWGCGDGECNSDETAESCPTDCYTGGYCGDYRCGAGETRENCPSDCQVSYCGNGRCEPEETSGSCPQDCRPTCDFDWKCEPSMGETQQNCPHDCGAPTGYCGDNTCDPHESGDTCPEDCGGAFCDYDGYCDPEESESCNDCGCNRNGVCELSRGETSGNCPGDCKVVDVCNHNGVCELSRGETYAVCPDDCELELCNYNGECEAYRGETYGTCPEDCGAPGYCGDRVCDYGETFGNCPSDCMRPCNYNRLCEPSMGETRETCPDDCRAEKCNRNGVCEPWNAETFDTCAYDCKCDGDGACEPQSGETEMNCPQDCKLEMCNWDGQCEPWRGENPGSCPDDCGCDGDGACEPHRNENADNCPQDCKEGLCNYNGACEPHRNENADNCQDCGCNWNEDCEPRRGENPENCPKDCGQEQMCNHNGECEAWLGEHSENCPDDCKPLGYCGDGRCDPGEESWCWGDCEHETICGDGQCDYPHEDDMNCAEDCKAARCDPCNFNRVCNQDEPGCCNDCRYPHEGRCGDDICDEDETLDQQFCFEDCGFLKKRKDCNFNGWCDSFESPECPDCQKAGECNPNRRCEPGETEESCPQDCFWGDCNHDGECDGYEGPLCPDCRGGLCNHNGMCEEGEHRDSCPWDCEPQCNFDGRCQADEGPQCQDCGGGGCRDNGECEPGEPYHCKDCLMHEDCDNDGICEEQDGEGSWCKDCGGMTGCFDNGFCDPGEPPYCKDCHQMFCGDGTCGSGEDMYNCPDDCMRGEQRCDFDNFCDRDEGPWCPDCKDMRFCGDGKCDGSEDPFNCPQDCSARGWCGDGKCDPIMGENDQSCPQDCGKKGTCGDRICGPGESPETCSRDCMVSECGNGICEPGEKERCPMDCRIERYCGDGICEGYEETWCIDDCEIETECGNGICEHGEYEVGCEDCRREEYCGDGYCGGYEDHRSCPHDCAPPGFCGNGICEDEEDLLCPIDCGIEGFCGDGFCGFDETPRNCQQDCTFREYFLNTELDRFFYQPGEKVTIIAKINDEMDERVEDAMVRANVYWMGEFKIRETRVIKMERTQEMKKEEKLTAEKATLTAATGRATAAVEGVDVGGDSDYGDTFGEESATKIGPGTPGITMNVPPEMKELLGKTFTTRDGRSIMIAMEAGNPDNPCPDDVCDGWEFMAGDCMDDCKDIPGWSPSRGFGSAGPTVGPAGEGGWRGFEKAKDYGARGPMMMPPTVMEPGMPETGMPTREMIDFERRGPKPEEMEDWKRDITDKFPIVLEWNPEKRLYIGEFELKEDAEGGQYEVEVVALVEDRKMHNRLTFTVGKKGEEEKDVFALESKSKAAAMRGEYETCADGYVDAADLWIEQQHAQRVIVDVEKASMCVVLGDLDRDHYYGRISEVVEGIAKKRGGAEKFIMIGTAAQYMELAGRHTDAKRMYQKAVMGLEREAEFVGESDPEGGVMLRLILAKYYEMIGREKDAVRTYKDVAERIEDAFGERGGPPEFIQALISAKLYEVAGALEEARGAYESAADMVGFEEEIPGDAYGAVTAFMQGYCLEKAGDRKTAMRKYEEASDLFDDIEMIDTEGIFLGASAVGKARERLGQPEYAEDAYRAALKNLERRADGDGYYFVSGLAGYLGDFEKAKIFCKKELLRNLDADDVPRMTFYSAYCYDVLGARGKAKAACNLAQTMPEAGESIMMRFIFEPFPTPVSFCSKSIAVEPPEPLPTCGNDEIDPGETEDTCCLDVGCGAGYVCSAALGKCVLPAEEIDPEKILMLILELEEIRMKFDSLASKALGISEFFEKKGDIGRAEIWAKVADNFITAGDKIDDIQRKIKDNRDNLTEAILEGVRQDNRDLRDIIRKAIDIILEAV